MRFLLWAGIGARSSLEGRREDGSPAWRGGRALMVPFGGGRGSGCVPNVWAKEGRDWGACACACAATGAWLLDMVAGGRKRLGESDGDAMAVRGGHGAGRHGLSSRRALRRRRRRRCAVVRRRLVVSVLQPTFREFAPELPVPALVNFKRPMRFQLLIQSVGGALSLSAMLTTLAQTGGGRGQQRAI